ncbi:MAG: hypothetical protein ACRDJ4_14035 [Actinomycetota bacterium]
MRIERGGERWYHWAALGLIGGLGWWTTPQILFFAVPALVWLAVRRRKEVVGGLALTAVPFLIGAAPWIVYNVREPLASLTSCSSKAGLVWERLVVFSPEGSPPGSGSSPTSGGWFPWPPRRSASPCSRSPSGEWSDVRGRVC